MVVKIISCIGLLLLIAITGFLLNYRRHRKGSHPIAETIEDIIDGDPRDMKAVNAEQAAMAEEIDRKAREEWKSSIENARKKTERSKP